MTPIAQPSLKRPDIDLETKRPAPFLRQDATTNLATELQTDAAATGDTIAQPADGAWTPNCLVRRHNTGVERIAGISSCLGFVRKLEITATSSRLGDIVKIAVFALANVALAICDVVKGAFTVIKSVVTKVVCCCRKTATPPAEETPTEEQLAAKKFVEKDSETGSEHFVGREERKALTDLREVNARLHTQDLAMSNLSRQFNDLTYRVDNNIVRLRNHENMIGESATIQRSHGALIQDLTATTKTLRTAQADADTAVKGSIEVLNKESAPLRGLGKVVDSLDTRTSDLSRQFGRLENQMELLGQRIPIQFMPRPQQAAQPLSLDSIPELPRSSSSSLPAQSSSSSSSRTLARQPTQEDLLNDRMARFEGNLGEILETVRHLQPAPTPAPTPTPTPAAIPVPPTAQQQPSAQHEAFFM